MYIIGRPLSSVLLRAGKMAQRVEVLATKPDNLSSIPVTSMVEGEN